MKRTAPPSLAAVSAICLLALVGCETKKSSNPLSPSVAGPIPGVEITSPALVEPAQGSKFKESQQPIRLTVSNAQTNGVRPVTYTFEVASDSNFDTKLFAKSNVPQGDNGRTSVVVDALGLGRSYFWRARADDGANMSIYSTASFEVLPRPQLDPPVALSPVNNEQTARQPQLTVNNSTRNAAVGDLNYDFQVATDQAFTKLVASGIVAEMSGLTRFTTAGELTGSLQHFWRVRTSDGETTSAWSVTQTFRTAAPPAPTPSPSPSPTPGGPCVSGNPQSLVECERAKYGRMNSSQTVDFLKAVARSLNGNGISGGPFGILRKNGGASCNGYSCDIICAGNGNGQRQWDVLGDAEGSQTPGWGGPHTLPNIRVDVCEIQ